MLCLFGWRQYACGESVESETGSDLSICSTAEWYLTALAVLVLLSRPAQTTVSAPTAPQCSAELAAEPTAKA